MIVVGCCSDQRQMGRGANRRWGSSGRLAWDDVCQVHGATTTMQVRVGQMHVSCRSLGGQLGARRRRRRQEQGSGMGGARMCVWHPTVCVTVCASRVQRHRCALRVPRRCAASARGFSDPCSSSVHRYHLAGGRPTCKSHCILRSETVAWYRVKFISTSLVVVL